MKQVEQFKKLEAKKIPEDLDYEKVGSLRIEARQKLEEYRPDLHWTGIQNFRCITGRYFCTYWYIWNSTEERKKTAGCYLQKVTCIQIE